MGHYKSNLRDIEFNLFEVFGPASCSATGRSPTSTRPPSARCWPSGRARRGPDRRLLRRRRPQPAGVRPGDHSVTLPDSFKASWRALVDAEFWRLEALPELGGRPRPAGWSGRWPSRCSARTRPCRCTSAGVPTAGVLYRNGTPDQQRLAQLDDRPRLGRYMVLTEPDAGSDVGAGTHQGDRAARRQLAPRGRQAVHHQRRARPHREHRPPRAGPAGGRRARAPRGCRCSSCRSSWSTSTPASSASATAST